MTPFDDAYGDGSLAALHDELSLPAAGGLVALPVTGIEDLESLGNHYLRIAWRPEQTEPVTADVSFIYTDPEVWVYTQFSLWPPGRGLYTRLSLRFCLAAIKRQVPRFEAPALMPDSRAALAASKWDLDEQGGASVTPARLRTYGQEAADG